MIKHTTTHTLRVIGSDLTIADLIEFLTQIDDPTAGAKVRVKTESPDRPGEQSVTTVTVVIES